MAMHVRFNSWYISSPFSAKQQREMTKFWVMSKTCTRTANFVSLSPRPRFIFVIAGVANVSVGLGSKESRGNGIFGVLLARKMMREPRFVGKI